MHWVLFSFLALSPAMALSDAPVSPSEQKEEPAPSDDIQDCQKASKELKNSVAGLEFFLQDKKDYKNYCPYTKWEQPKLDEYKKEPKSYLPKECKAEKI